MNNNRMNTKAIVMSRVRAIHLMRPFVSGTFASAVLLVGALWGIGREVWVAKVIQNIPTSDVIAFGNFFVNAFLSTSFLVQALSVLVIFATAYAARETAKLLVSTPVRVSL